MNPIVTLTDSAAVYIKKMMEKSSSPGFRLSVKKTGCSGYSYVPAIIESVNATDHVVSTEHGVDIYIDTAWLHLLQNIHIDYVEDDKSGLKQKRLVFVNANESSRCGCGESFHVQV